MESAGKRGKEAGSPHRSIISMYRTENQIGHKTAVCEVRIEQREGKEYEGEG